MSRLPLPAGRRISGQSGQSGVSGVSGESGTSKLSGASGMPSRVFQTIDADHGGTISREEWMVAFDKIDAARRGVVSRKEWSTLGGENFVFDAIAGRSQFAVASRRDWREAFARMDKDRNGGISWEEWLALSPNGRGDQDHDDNASLLSIRSAPPVPASQTRYGGHQQQHLQTLPEEDEGWLEWQEEKRKLEEHIQQLLNKQDRLRADLQGLQSSLVRKTQEVEHSNLDVAHCRELLRTSERKKKELIMETRSFEVEREKFRVPAQTLKEVRMREYQYKAQLETARAEKEELQEKVRDILAAHVAAAASPGGGEAAISLQYEDGDAREENY